MKRLYILTICTALLAAGIFFLRKKSPTTIRGGQGLIVPKEWLATKQQPVTPQKDVRPPDQTFLTFPEWFLVFSPEEQANYFKHHTATTFPFDSHIAQIWESYSIVNDQIKDNFPSNPGYQLMIWVIGTSSTVEYFVKAWYEIVIGRITDTAKPVTEEDIFNAQFTDDYVRFIKERPWYEFDFADQLHTLWTFTSLTGDHMLRKIERKYILTSELLVKYVYGKLIGFGSAEVYDVALPTTAVVLNNDSLVYLPRYDKFASAALDVSKQGYSFKEIAGNNSAILITILIQTPKLQNFPEARTLFTQPVASDRSVQRVALVVPVAKLHDTLLQLEQQNIVIEHVFDY
jgi:hypothetical protein